MATELALQRHHQVMELRDGGLSYRAIAERLGMDTTRVYDYANPTRHSCKRCGDEFLSFYRRAKGIYCSPDCSAKALAPARSEVALDVRDELADRYVELGASREAEPGVKVAIRVPAGHEPAWVLVDPQDVQIVEARPWRLHPKGYVTHGRREGGRNRIYYLHREILGCHRGDGAEVDHHNGNKLDNRRGNLRLATRAQNAQNIRIRRRARGYRGVSRTSDGTGWRARVAVDGTTHHLGTFDTEDEALAAVWAFRRERVPFANDARDLERAAA